MAESLYRRLGAIRRGRGELLKDMANKLALGSAELSSIEHAKKSMSSDFLEKVRILYPEYDQDSAKN